MKTISNWLSGALLVLLAGNAGAALLGPTAYLSSADSPFAPFTGFSYFHLEDFEDGLLNTPGVTAAGTSLCVVNTAGCFPGSALIDSVDADNGAIDGFGGFPGHDLFSTSGSGGITFTFDGGVLGALPNAVGIVWTDGVGMITFEAFDQDNNSLGTLTGTHADGAVTGGTAEDRFYGVTTSGGISKIKIKNASGGIEVDHLQYGLRGSGGTIPEPDTLALLGLGLAGLAAMHRRKVARRSLSS